MGTLALLIPGMGNMEWIIILVVVLVLFGPSRLPKLGKMLGKSVKSVRDGLEGKLDDEDEEPALKAKADATAKSAAKDDEDASEE